MRNKDFQEQILTFHCEYCDALGLELVLEVGIDFNAHSQFITNKLKYEGEFI